MTFFRYGAFTHPQNEALLRSFTKTPKYSRRGTRRESAYRMRIEGERQAEGQHAINDLVIELADAYKNDYSDAALLLDDFTPTPHAILNSHPDNMSGTKIVARSWPRGDPGEYATYRHYSITIGATFRELDDQIIQYREETRTYGSGGARYAWVNTMTGAPRLQVLNLNTTKRYIQTGMATGYDGWPDLAVPAPAWGEPFLQPHLTRIERTGPLYMGNQFAEYIIRWSYTMIRPDGAIIIPTQR